MRRIKIKKILGKKGKDPIICLTAYSKPIANIIDKYCDIILVGDSVGMTLYGMKTTKEVNLDTMILHAKAVKNISKSRSFRYEIVMCELAVLFSLFGQLFFYI